MTRYDPWDDRPDRDLDYSDYERDGALAAEEHAATVAANVAAINALFDEDPNTPCDGCGATPDERCRPDCPYASRWDRARSFDAFGERLEGEAYRD